MDDVQSWSEIPAIAHFCSLFSIYFNLIDFDIEDLEEALLNDSAEEVANSLLQELIVRILKGCFDTQQDEITTSNYQMYLRRLFRKKCEEGSTKNNPFESDAAFHSLPLRTKVEILYDLCDFRLDSEDVPESLKSLESDSLRVEPLGRDSGGSTYWYFYGTRLYREDYYSEKSGASQKRGKKGLEVTSVKKWQVVCYTEEDWQVLTRKFKNCKSPHERNLHRTLSSDFLPALPRLFAEKEKLQRKRMLEQQLRRGGRAILTNSNQVNEDMPLSPHKKLPSITKQEDMEDDAESDKKVSGEDDIDEDDLRRQREEQEKADRLLAEEIEREERKSRLHLRERRGGAVIPAISVNYVPTVSSKKSTRDEDKSGSRSGSASTSRSKSKSPVKKAKGKMKKKEPRRMTNNSLSASIQSAVKAKGAKRNEDADEEDEEDEDAEERDEEDSESGDEEEDKEDADSENPSLKTSKKFVVKKGKNLDKDKRQRKEKSRERDKKKKSRKDKVKERERGKSSDKEYKSKSYPKEKSSSHFTPVTPTPSSLLHLSKTKVKGSVLFSQSEEEVQTGMHKVIEQIKNHVDAWPFINPVDEDYAPNYYRVISSPMDLQTMEDKLDNQEYVSLEEFMADFQRIVENCIKYNGPSSEYTEMVETLQDAFNKSVQRYIVPDESDEEINIDYSNIDAEKKKKRPRTDSHFKDKTREHKKENEPAMKKKSPPKKIKPKHEVVAKKMKHKLMRHHSKDSEAIENLHSATSETLKDLDKWLNETTKPLEYSTSSALAFDNLRSRILEDDNDRAKLLNKGPGESEAKKTVVEAVTPSSHSSTYPKHKGSTHRKRHYDEEEDEPEYSPPKKKVLKKMDKELSRYDRKATPKRSEDRKSKKSTASSKEKKPKEKRHHKHRHSSESGSSKRSSVPPAKINEATKNKIKKYKEIRREGREGSYQSSGIDSNSSTTERSHSHVSRTFDDKSTPTPTPESTPAPTPPPPHKRKKVVKNVKGLIKKTKSSSDSVGSKTTESSQMSSGRESTISTGESKPEKKKCLLLNEKCSTDKEGVKLSLGTVLSTDAIKLKEFSKNEMEDDDLDSPSGGKSGDSDEKGDAPSKPAEDSKRQPGKDEKVGKKDPENEEEEEVDRKLEPSKGFKPEKCMPNLSAWIKAFGGPSIAKTASNSPVSNSSRKTESETKKQFKVMGRSVGEQQPSTENYRGTVKHSPKGPSKLGSHDPHWNSSQPIKPGELPQVINLSEDISSSSAPHPHHKKHRHRKVSTSSLSSQSESGSPHCFTNQDGVHSGMGSVVNPPRWADEHWSHTQTQSPSASSHVSSQSPANSPFSPGVNSPPHTPQTPPRPTGPMRVGFYQDTTSQHSSPEKINEPHSNSNSNVASPSTPPTPTSTYNNGRRGGGEGSASGKHSFSGYHTSTYTPRYTTGTPSPSFGPGSNIQSPSPGGVTNVESPGNPNSPHSPNVSHPPSVPDYKLPSYSQSSSVHHAQSISSSRHSSVPENHSVHARNTPSVISHHLSHSPSPSISPYPPPPNHYGHPSVRDLPHPENAHSGSAQGQVINQVQAHSQHYERYTSHHHQISSAGTLPPAAAATMYTQNLTAAHSQRPSTAPSPYATTNPYASNPRNVNIPPNLYNTAMAAESAMSRYYKPSSSSSKQSGSSASETTSSGSRSRGSRSAAAPTASDLEPPRAASVSIEGKLSHTELAANGFQWPHNLNSMAQLSQIVNSIPNPMNAVTAGIANAYRQYDQAMVESISKYQRGDPSGYTNLSASAAAITASSKASATMHPPAAHSQPTDRLPSDVETSTSSSSSSSSHSRRQSKAEAKAAARSQASSSKSNQPIVSASAFNFSSLSPTDLALYPKEMTDSSLYSGSPPTLAHRSDLYPTSTSTFHPSLSSTARTTAGGVPTPSISPYQIPPFIGSHPSPYQPQTTQHFAHSQSSRGLVDPYQQFFQSSHLGLLPPAGYPYPHFNRPGWI